MFGRGQLYVGANLHKVITQNNCYYYRASYALCSLPEHIELSDYHIVSLCHRRLCLWLDLYYPEVVYHLILIMPKFRTCYYKYIIAHPVFTARVPIRASQVSPTSSRSSAIMTVVDATLWLIPAFLSISGVPVSKICVWPLCLLCLLSMLACACSLCPSCALELLSLGCCCLPDVVAVYGHIGSSSRGCRCGCRPLMCCTLVVPLHHKIKSSCLPGHRLLPQVMYSANSDRGKMCSFVN